MPTNRYAAFIMTYERPEILEKTIHSVLSLNLKPEKLLIVDNSISVDTQNLIQSFNNPVLEYYRVGYNSGPAGAAKIGLQYFTNKGFDWVYWCDDDNPPEDPFIFNGYFDLLKRRSNVGIIGIVGGKFVPFRARTRGFMNRELKPVTQADYCTGYSHMMINTEVCQKMAYPNPDLFFGYEELDFCLKVKKAGYDIIFDGNRLLDERVRSGKSSPAFMYRSSHFGNMQYLNREYYSIRNMLYILWTNHFYTGYIYFSFKTIFKMLVSFFLIKTFYAGYIKIAFLAFLHHYQGKYGINRQISAQKSI